MLQYNSETLSRELDCLRALLSWTKQTVSSMYVSVSGGSFSKSPSPLARSLNIRTLSDLRQETRDKPNMAIFKMHESTN